jgi:A/G-specific adenine glycosylase
MLQQTGVVTVIPYYQKFLALWPQVQDMAAASLDQILHAWAGLGYYSRARNLKKCADLIASEYGGVFPKTEKALLELPGIGPYTAAAIAAIAYGQRATVVDGNVERVISRVFSITEPLPTSKPEIRSRAVELTPKSRAGDYAQAIMELGATICTPKNPQCANCPWMKHCQARVSGLAPMLPKKLPRAAKPTRQANLLFLYDRHGNVLMRRRPETGLLAHLWEFPSAPWIDKSLPLAADLSLSDFIVSPGKVKLEILEQPVRHTFTHFHLELKLFVGQISTKSIPIEGDFLSAEQIQNKALPTLMKKVMSTVAESDFKSVKLSKLSLAWRKSIDV